MPKGARPESLIKAVVPSPLEHGYRTSGKLCLHEDEVGRKTIGLYERGTKKVAPIPECTVHHPEINKLVERLFGFGKKLPAPFYQHTKKSFQAGRLKFVVIRYSPETKEFGLVISHTGVDREELKTWAAGLKLAHVSLYESELKPEDDDLVMARETSYLAGPRTFRFQIGSSTFHIDPMAFFQANHSLAGKFIETIAGWHKGQSLLDLYGGFGTYSFQASPGFERLTVVEANPHSIASAEEFKNRNTLSQVETKALSVEEFLKAFLKKDEAAAVSDIIINPPRTGITRTVIESLRSPRFQKLERLTYVSCDLTTLKRDLREILKDGLFVMEEALPFDMFPQTEHIETVVRLRRVAKESGSSEKKPFPSAPRDRGSNSSRERPSSRIDRENRSGRSLSRRGASRSGTPGKPKA